VCLEKKTDLKTPEMDIPTFRNGADGELAEEAREAERLGEWVSCRPRDGSVVRRNEGSVVRCC